jgi:hypothetical protein
MSSHQQLLVFQCFMGKDNWESEIALSLEESIRPLLNGIRNIMDQMNQALHTLIVAIHRRGRGDG